MPDLGYEFGIKGLRGGGRGRTKAVFDLLDVINRFIFGALDGVRHGI
jgi:hypothetical protein